MARHKCLKVNFCAAPGSGKSTICAGLESKLKQDGILIDTSKEYARHYINTYGVPRDIFEQLLITEKQDIQDNSIVNVSEIMLCDTPAMAGYVFGLRILDEIIKKEQRDIRPSEYRFIETMHEKGLRKARWYDIIFVFPPLEVVDDGTRREDTAASKEVYDALVGFLNCIRVPYIVIDGTAQEKIDQCYEILKKAHIEAKNKA